MGYERPPLILRLMASFSEFWSHDWLPSPADFAVRFSVNPVGSDEIYESRLLVPSAAKYGGAA